MRALRIIFKRTRSENICARSFKPADRAVVFRRAGPVQLQSMQPMQGHARPRLDLQSIAAVRGIHGGHGGLLRRAWLYYLEYGRALVDTRRQVTLATGPIEGNQ